jgi:CRP-like cAMP-binding protein
MRFAHQTIGCIAAHGAESRMCRWVLMAQDRMGQDEFRLTHEFLAEMLGVRRPTVTLIAGTLQQAGFIAYRRGILRVRDRKSLEAASCECYQVLKHMYDLFMR